MAEKAIIFYNDHYMNVYMIIMINVQLYVNH